MKNLRGISFSLIALIVLCLISGFAFADDSLYIDPYGFVGIGTTSPESKLHIKDGTGGKQLRFTRGTGTVRLEQNNDEDTLLLFNSDGGQNYMTWKDGGNVGIGTTTPESKLHIKDGTGGKQLRFTRGTGTVRLEQNNNEDTLFLFNSDGSKNYMTWKNTGNVGIGTANPGYTLDVVGNIHCTGTISSDNGNDPPYMIYTFETRQSIIDRVKDEVTPDKLSGAVLFFNGGTSKMEVFLPAKGEFRSLGDKLLASVAPITETFEVEDRYYLDRKTGKVKNYKVRKAPAERFKIKADHELDPMTGKFFKKIKDKDGNEIDKIEVPKEEAVEDEKAEDLTNS